jgi:hypothetical protein
MRAKGAKGAKGAGVLRRVRVDSREKLVELVRPDPARGLVELAWI